MTKYIPILYKQDSKGRIQSWENNVEGSVIVTRFGKLNGKIQENREVITEGKNVGKANATTPEQQAFNEAISRWTKKKKSGYVETKEQVLSDKTDILIQGGINPMLAHSFSKHASKMNYPCSAQPKMDGHRCIAVVKNGICTLWSRTRRPIKSVPHICQAIEKAASGKNIILDGELYVSSSKLSFEKLTSIIRKDEPDEDYQKVEYWIYDLPSHTGKWLDRFSELNFFLKSCSFPLRKVETITLKNENEIIPNFKRLLSEGYEGMILRSFDNKYEHCRSYGLLKVKEFNDAEFKIVDIKEGRGKLAGHAIFICINEKNETFDVKMNGKIETLKEYFDDHSLWLGKNITVQYQGFTTKGLPRFPVGLRLRQDI